MCGFIGYFLFTLDKIQKKRVSSLTFLLRLGPLAIHKELNADLILLKL